VYIPVVAIDVPALLISMSIPVFADKVATPQSKRTKTLFEAEDGVIDKLWEVVT